MVGKNGAEMEKKGYTLGQGKSPWFCPWQSALCFSLQHLLLWEYAYGLQ